MNKEKLLRAIAQEVLQDYDSVEISEMTKDFDNDREKFCDRFELGNWFYDLFDLADVELNDILSDVYDSHRINEIGSEDEYRKSIADMLSEDYDE